MKSSAKNISLSSLDDLFSTEEERSRETVGTIVSIPLSQLHDFPNHPFKVRDDEKMEETVERWKKRKAEREKRGFKLDKFLQTGEKVPIEKANM